MKVQVFTIAMLLLTPCALTSGAEDDATRKPTINPAPIKKTTPPDAVYLQDGSRLVGHIQTLAAGQLTMTTKFAPTVTLDAKQIKGITTGGKMVVALAGGDRAIGKLVYDEQNGQKITGTAFGDVTLQNPSFVGLWTPGQPDPNLAAAKKVGAAELKKVKDDHKTAVDKIKAEYAKQVAELTKKVDQVEQPWKIRLELGLNGSTGNTEEVNFRGRAEAKRTGLHDRLTVFTEVNFGRQSGTRSKNEALGGVNLEIDINERWYTYGRIGLEYDEFESLDIRATAAIGVGYFAIKKPNHELKLRAGAGYRHESFNTGISTDEGIVEFGYDYRIDVNEFVSITDSLTYQPSLDDPLGDYILVHQIAAEIPLGKKDNNWKLKVGMKNEYDSMPQPGIDRLDTSYFLNLVFDLE